MTFMLHRCVRAVIRRVLGSSIVFDDRSAERQSQRQRYMRTSITSLSRAVIGLSGAPNITPLMSHDLTTISTLRRAMDEVLLDERFHRCKTVSALEIAEHLLAKAATGERDLERLKSSAFAKLIEHTERFPIRVS